MLISGCFPVAKSRLSLSCAFAKASRREAARAAMRNREGEKGWRGEKKGRYSNQLASDDYLSRGTARHFFMRCSVYALIRLDEREKKKIVQTALQRRQPLLYPSPLPPFSTLPFVFRPFPESPRPQRMPCDVRARIGMTRKLVIKPSFNLSLVIRNCQRRGTGKKASGNNNANSSKHRREPDRRWRWT